MHDDLNQKLSQLLDNELDRHETLSLLQKIQSDPYLNGKLNRYQAISHALKTESFLLPKADFSAAIARQVKQEPAYLLPRHTPKPLFKRSHKMLAAAASIAVVSVIVSRGSNFPTTAIQNPSLLQSPIALSALQSKPYPINKQINDYLQAHNSSVYTNGQANFQPYTQVTTFNQK